MAGTYSHVSSLLHISALSVPFFGENIDNICRFNLKILTAPSGRTVSLVLLTPRRRSSVLNFSLKVHIMMTILGTSLAFIVLSKYGRVP